MIKFENVPVREKKTSAPRLANIERLRLLAMFEIVAYHVSDQRFPVIAGLGLPTFLILNNVFNYTLSEKMGEKSFLKAKWDKLFLPWLAWSGVYALLIVAEKVRHGENVLDAFTPWMIIGGVSIHLWFIPFALFGSALIAKLQKVINGIPTTIAVPIGLIISIQLMALSELFPHLEWPFQQWIFALPAVFLGLTLGKIISSDERSYLISFFGVSTTLALCGEFLGLSEKMCRYSGSIALISLAFIFHGKYDKVSKYLTPLLFGVYLSHPLILRLYRSTHVELHGYLAAFMIFGISIGLVYLLQKTRFKKLV